MLGLGLAATRHSHRLKGKRKERRRGMVTLDVGQGCRRPTKTPLPETGRTPAHLIHLPVGSLRGQWELADARWGFI